MKYSLSAFALLAIPAAACAQTPEAPQPPATPEISKVTEDCGDGCSRTVTTVRTSETDDYGHEIIKKEIEVIELQSDGGEQVDIDMDVETAGDGERIIRKKVKVVTAVDGEITPEMQAKIDAMLSDIDDEHVWHSKGDGVVVLDSSGDAQKMRVIIRSDDDEIVHTDDAAQVEQIENSDGSKTIRITPEDGSETTVITIKKEKIVD